MIETIRGHKRSGYTVNVTIEEVEDLCKSTINCPICGVFLNWNVLKSKASPSLDRIDNENELNINNIQLLCLRCNMTKGDMTMKQFIEYCSQVSNKFLINQNIGECY